VLLEQQVLQHSTLGHQPEQVEVAAEKHVQAHLWKEGGREREGEGESRQVRKQTLSNKYRCADRRMVCMTVLQLLLLLLLLLGLLLLLQLVPSPPTPPPTHLDVVAVLVLEAGHLATHPLATLIDVHLMTGGQQQAVMAAAEENHRFRGKERGYC
jgi:hypothetical protein